MLGAQKLIQTMDPVVLEQGNHLKSKLFGGIGECLWGSDRLTDFMLSSTSVSPSEWGYLPFLLLGI